MFESLGPALRLLRQEAGLSQRQLVQRCRVQVAGCRVTQAMISQWERGATQPQLDLLGHLLTGLGVSLIDLQGALQASGSNGARSLAWVGAVPAVLLLAREIEVTSAHRRALQHRMAVELSAHLGLPEVVLAPLAEVERNGFLVRS